MVNYIRAVFPVVVLLVAACSGMEVANGPYKGSRDAPVTIIEYTDYQCPYCARHARTVMPQIQKNYVDTGKVRYVLRDFPLPFHKQAAKAGEAAHCAGERGRYWEMHDKLLENQRALGEAALREYAKAIDINVRTFTDCLDSGKYSGRVTESIAEGRKAGVRGTPSFVIGYTDGDAVKGGKLIQGAVEYAVFQAAFEELLIQEN